MFYSNTSSQVFPDQNVFYGPFYMQHPFFRSQQQRTNAKGSSSEEESKAQGHLNSTFMNSAFPRQVKLVVLQNEKEENLVIANSSRFFIKAQREQAQEQNPSTQSETHISDFHSDSENAPKAKFTVTRNNFSNEMITEFNNHPKLKKINSSYHLKRKISTKLQNDLKDSINSLIAQINSQLQLQLPFMTHNSKEFRENVKIEFLKHYGNQTVAKYVCEDVLVERKTPTSAGLESNKRLIKKIEELYQFNPQIAPLKKLICLLHTTLVKDFYTSFLESPRYRKCLEKDIAKYSQKLCKIDHFSNEKKKIFSEIYSVKYDGNAREYFT